MMIARSTLAFCLASAALAQTTYTISTPIGGTTGLSVPTYSGTPRQIGGGTNLGLDSSGNVYFGDNVYQLLYEYSGGKISPFPQLGQSGIEAPAGIACDAAGNVYVTDGLQNYIDKFPPGALSAGFASVVAGSRGAAAFGGDNGPATQAMLNAPSGITLDSKGNIYFADTGNKRIRKISNGTITTIAGGGALPLNATNVGKAATSIAFTGPTGPAVDASGNVYLAESGNVYQVSAATGILSLVAGCLTGCTGTALQATATAVDSNGDLYIAEAFGYRIRVLHNGVLSTIAGTGVAGTSGDNGPSTSAQITRPYSIAVDSAFRVWVSTDSGIRLLTPASGASINTGGIVPINSTTPTVQTGSWVSIYGKNLASGTTVWNGDFPTTLGGVSVAIDSKPAYLWFTSPGQINVQVPDDATTGLVNVVVNTASGTATSSVTLAAQAPSFNLLDATHIAGVILTPQGNGAYAGGTYDLVGPTGAFSYSTRPVKAGETLLLYGVGFGPTTPVVPAGHVYSGAAPTNSPVSVSIGGVPAVVSFAGIVGSGLYQINLTMPANTGSGDKALQATINGVGTPVGPVVTVQ